MELQIVNPQPKYRPATLTDPPLLGYIHIGAVVAPPGRGPFPPRSAERTALLARLKALAAQLEGLGTVQKATVYRAVLVPPVGGEARRRGARPARFDVAVLVETTRPEVIDEVQGTEPYKLLLEAVTEAAEDVHVMAARCPKRIGDVDKTRPGLFLFNHFVAEDPDVAYQLWDYLAGWYAVETKLDNSTLLVPVGDADYVFVNHARWDYGLPALMWHQMSKPTFRSYVLANLRANGTVAMPVLYRIA